MLKYRPDERFYDEMYSDADRAHVHCQGYHEWLLSRNAEELRALADAAARFQNETPATSDVGHCAATDELSALSDIVPRILSYADWCVIESGVTQRVRALNAFLGDIYGKGRIVRDHVIPAELFAGNLAYKDEMRHVTVAHDIYCHVYAPDVVRAGHGSGGAAFYVLEDNVGTPGGIGAAIVIRQLMSSIYERTGLMTHVRSGANALDILRHCFEAAAPRAMDDPGVVVLSKGPGADSYAEHLWIARQLEIPVVSASDLRVESNHVVRQTPSGMKRIDVIYRRVSDDNLTRASSGPHRAEELPGLLSAVRARTVTIANAIGSRIAGDKSVYRYVPSMIRYYLSEDPILENIPTFYCGDDRERRHVLDNLDTLVVKHIHGRAGLGLFVGPEASKDDRAICAQRIAANPSQYVAQAFMPMSTCPTLGPGGLVPRHVDLKPFVLCCPDQVHVLPIPMCRVALKPKSVIVSGTHGGGLKDAWILARSPG
jgi:uncharacterized circularly permuted ATP-grasp superfamily protein